MDIQKKIIDLEIIDAIPESGVSELALVDAPAIEKLWMAFKKEKFVNPTSGEHETEFIPRCIAKLVGEEGYETDQAAAICYSTWKETHSKEVEMEINTDSLPNYVHQTGKKEKFSIVEDKKIVVGPVAIPDIEIIRQDPDTKEVYWVRFSAEVIQKMAEKFMRENRNNETNLEHDTTADAKSYVFESWIVEEPTDKANSVYNLDVPVGTWCVKMRITDPAIWKEVKAGKLNGFSLEGSFVSKEELDQYNKDREIYNNIVKILNSY